MMPRGRKLCRSLPPGFFNNLPDNIIDAILKCLPFVDAVRTSILSKKWRYHWCRLTELTLDSSLWKAQKVLLNPTVKFTKIIYQILTLHEGPITKFSLRTSWLKNSCPTIDNFIYFLSRNYIQDLVLLFPCDMLYKLPSSLFTCSQLRHLILHNCLIHPQLAFQGFDKLISLTLYSIRTSSEFLESLISRCPLLELLVLTNPEILDIIEIDAPMLRSFYFSGDLSSICLKNVPLLAKVSLVADDMKAEDLDFAKIFESCSALEHLFLNSFRTKFFAEEGYEAPTRLPFDLSVKRFYLPCIMLVDSYSLSYAFCLIRSSPYLESLEIEVYSEAKDADRIVESLELEHFSDVTFNHLREVKLERFGGTMPEMQLIKLLLAKSPVLVRMLIDTCNLDNKPLETRLQIFAEVSNFLRASHESKSLNFFEFVFFTLDPPLRPDNQFIVCLLYV